MDNDTIPALVQIDAAMMGQEWRGNADDLRQFCAILQELIGEEYRVVAITDSHNGARQITDEDSSWTIDNAWFQALDEFYETKRGGEVAENKNETTPTAWKFVWNDSGRFFSSPSRRAIEAYAAGALSSFGEGCGRIEPMFDPDPYIVEGRE